MNFPFPYHDPSTAELQHVSADALEWRVADACNHAIWPLIMNLLKPPKWLQEGRVDFQVVAQLCWKLSMLGLDPIDLDNTEGHAAIQAIAAAIMCDTGHPTQIWIHDEVLTMFPSPEWEKIIRAAQHLLWRQPRRYEVDRETR